MYTEQIEKAIQAAAVLHAGQTRKGPVPIPYVSHVFSVFSIVRDYTDSEVVLVAALLHDTIEDTDYTETALLEDFGEAVRDIVNALSEDKSISDWQTRKDGYLAQVKAGGEPVQLVAAADKIHNMRSMIEQYHNNIPGFLEEFARYHTKGQVFLQQMGNLLNSQLNSDIVHEFNHVFSEFKTFNEHVEKYQNQNA